MIYRIALEVEGNILFLRYLEKMIFTDCVGYIWKKEHLLNKILPGVKKIYPDAFVQEMSDEEYSKIKDSSSKATIIFPFSKRGRKPKEEGEISKPKGEKVDYTQNLESLEDDPDLEDYTASYGEEEPADKLFKKLNDHCIKCTHNCKQSWLSTIIRCDQFTPV